IESMVKEGTFREDLYYRLCVFPIRIPNLAERPEDIPALVNHFIEKYGQRFGITREISYDAMEYLLGHDWPGNIREIENVVQRLLINAKAGTILLYDVTRELNQDLFSGMNAQPAKPETVQGGQHLGDVVNEFEKQMIADALEKYGSTRKAAAAIGISQSQLIRKKKKYGIE
ncbi:MAG: sigma-54-dependent Fis family transcriptional regulator, partial [Firmicutes bacterium]|nr:sigma-54-dependent Fis family transcriptional regulator [Bacillota bacterium]